MTQPQNSQPFNSNQPQYEQMQPQFDNSPSHRASAPLPMTICGVIGLVLGIIAFILSFIPIINNFAAILGVVGLILAVIGMVGVFRGRKRGKALAITATVLCILALIITFAMQAAAGKALDDAMTDSGSSKVEGKKHDAKKNGSDKTGSNGAQDKTKASGQQETEGDLKYARVKIVSAMRSGNDYDNKPTVLVTYQWTNKSDKNLGFALAVDPKVFQNGKALDLAIYTQSPQGYDAQSYWAEVQPSAQASVTVGYVLQDDSPVTVDVSELLGGSAKVTHVFNI